MDANQLFLEVAFCYRDLRKEYHPYYSFGELMHRRHRLANHFLRAADVILQLNTDARTYLVAQFYTGEVPLPNHLYSKRAIKRYEDFVASRITVSDPDLYVETLSRAWNLSTDEVRRRFGTWL